MTLDPDHRSSLLASRLRALVAARGDGAHGLRTGSFPHGASLVDDAGGRCWILIERGGERRLGGALALALRAGASELHVIVDDPVAAGVLARRASAFASPPRVWRAEGLDLVAAPPAAPAVDPAPSPQAELYRPLLVAAGLEPVVEGGHLTGELRGLEVARVVVDDDGSARVEAGVGRFDREIASMMFGSLSHTDALGRVADLVGRQRSPGAARHPLNHLVPERWLRSVLLARPGLVGAAELRAVGSALPRRNLTEIGTATAVGFDPDGRELVVVCSTGVYLDLVPSAADDRLTHAPDARLVLAVPERDVVPITTELASQLLAPATVVPIAGDWRLLSEAGP